MARLFTEPYRVAAAFRAFLCAETQLHLDKTFARHYQSVKPQNS
jgi:hypothetical protein